MKIERHTRSKPISKVAATCKLFSVLCYIAFGLVIAWSILGIVLMCISLSTMNINDEALPLAIAMPLVYAIYNANSSLLPLIPGRMLGDLSSSRTPFTLRNANRLQFLGFVLLAYTALDAILTSLDTQFILMVDENSIEIGNFIYDLSANTGTSLNLFPLIMAAVFFALSYVFKYGVLLQQESDETL